MKAFITKYALTSGIEEVDNAETHHEYEGMLIVGGNSVVRSYYHGEGNNWHRTREGAVKRAEEMRRKKIESLKKQIKKLEKLKFE